MKTPIKKISAILLAVSMLFVITSCGSSESSDTSSDAEVVTYTVGTEPTYAPFESVDEDTNDLVGFDIDLMNEIAKDQGFKIKWANMSFDGLIPGLKSKNIDIIAAGMLVTHERAEQVDFSDTYYETGYTFLTKSDNDKFTSEDSLTPDTVLGAQVATTGLDACEQYKKDGKIKDYKSYNGNDVGVLDVKNGTIDAMVLNEVAGNAFVKKGDGEYKLVGKPLNTKPCAFAVSKDNTELLTMINDGLANLKEDGTYDDLFDKWMK